MGRKINPISLRLQVKKDWRSKWFSKKDYQTFLHEDLRLRKEILKKLESKAGVSRIDIERSAKQVTITLHSSRPGVIIGRGGSGVEDLRKGLQNITKGQIKINIEEVKNPEADAKLVALGVAAQIEKRISYKRAIRQAIDRAMKAGVKGIKIMASGRLAGAEIARKEKFSQGKIPLGTIKADIDYAFAVALTTYGIIGVKVWTYKETEKAAKKEPITEVT